ncbi:MAG: hypothetical protein ACI85N_002046, partial [Gammaproteobacteria bacterium]
MDPSISIFASGFATGGKPALFVIVKEYFDHGRSTTGCWKMQQSLEKLDV